GRAGNARIPRSRSPSITPCQRKEHAPMKKRRVSSSAVPEPPPQTWSNALVVGNQVFIAGMTARAGAEVAGGNSMYGQAKAIFEKIRHLMEAAGGGRGGNVQGVVLGHDNKRGGGVG